MSRFIDGKPDAGDGTVRGATSAAQWTRYEFELPVDTTASNINFGVLFTGTGTAWVDSMKVELDGEPYSNPQFDFDFESPRRRASTPAAAARSAALSTKSASTTQFPTPAARVSKMQFVGDEAAADLLRYRLTGVVGPRI